MRTINHKESLNLHPNDKTLFIFLCLFISLMLGCVVRVPYFIKYDFALNDGALFVQMSEAVRANKYILPSTVFYNKIEIPFAYPPLSFYLVAGLSGLFHLNILDVVRYMPLFFNILCICIFILIASRLIENKIILLYTSLFFPLIPRSYEWLIMGGGVTRSVGFFFTLLAIYQADRLLVKKKIQTLIYCSLFLSMALLSHLEWGITSLVTVTLLILYKQLSKRGLVLIITLGFLTLIITSPWWITVISRHGLTPFMAASKTSEWEPHTVANLISVLKIFDDGLGGIPLSVLAIVGWLLSVARKDWFLPVWLVVIFLTTPRHGATPAAMPLAILASISLEQFIRPILLRTATSIKNAFSTKTAQPILSINNTYLKRLLTDRVVTSIVIVTSILILTTTYYAKHTPLVALTDSERNGMAWIKGHTPSEAEFIVLTDSVSWQDDRVAEWFPVLAARKSLTTAQGLEWMPGNVFSSEVKSILELKSNQASGGRGLAEYIEFYYSSFQNVAVFIPGAETAYGEFLETGHYRVVYNQDSVVVFEKT